MSMATSHNLLYGFEIAFQGTNLLCSFAGVLLGNLIGVLPGVGALSAISMLLPLTYAMHPVSAVMMLAGIFYGAQYGGAIGAILLNLPLHPPHAVTCLDGYPMAKAGRGGAALGITMIASFFAASVGIVVMIFASPLLTAFALKFSSAEMFSIMLLGLLTGATMSRGSPLKGIAMTLFGVLCGIVGADLSTGTFRFTFGIPELIQGVELVPVAMGLFGVAEFLNNINKLTVDSKGARVNVSEMLPNRTEVKQAFWPMVRGTLVGTFFGAMPGTGPAITTFVAYALERKVSKTPEKFGTGMIAGIAAPEASTHAKVQIDFIPTLSLGVPGDAVMALILGALIVQGIAPGPGLINSHPDIFWGLIASFWIGNVILIILNVPFIGIWLKLLRIPFRFLFPLAMFFIAVGVFMTQNSFFGIWELLAFGSLGAIFSSLGFSVAPVLLGLVLGPMLEDNFRRALLIANGDMSVFVRRPISCVFIMICGALLLGVTVSTLKKWQRSKRQAGRNRMQAQSAD